ncbi:hypothetical protein TNIN_99631 [Trichonephila inaurata madagascariensis]|uniref:Uncharacterized protein n=1 Tax=Trichonephila inaurata madagascariensis TaxID=2747483 RepID=A0A8X7C015_9ARAC|nr:hypothetical protein TNIN_99631 [Trichonephila inaurata madagascariensis]
MARTRRMPQHLRRLLLAPNHLRPGYPHRACREPFRILSSQKLPSSLSTLPFPSILCKSLCSKRCPNVNAPPPEVGIGTFSGCLGCHRSTTCPFEKSWGSIRRSRGTRKGFDRQSNQKSRIYQEKARCAFLTGRIAENISPGSSQNIPLLN